MDSFIDLKVHQGELLMGGQFMWMVWSLIDLHRFANLFMETTESSFLTSPIIFDVDRDGYSGLIVLIIASFIFLYFQLQSEIIVVSLDGSIFFYNSRYSSFKYQNTEIKTSFL
jgi:hypothetical protein